MLDTVRVRFSFVRVDGLFDIWCIFVTTVFYKNLYAPHVSVYILSLSALKVSAIQIWVLFLHLLDMNLMPASTFV
jgi:hypothetical protein